MKARHSNHTIEEGGIKMKLGQVLNEATIDCYTEFLLEKRKEELKSKMQSGGNKG